MSSGRLKMKRRISGKPRNSLIMTERKACEPVSVIVLVAGMLDTVTAYNKQELKLKFSLSLG